jgi:hypothetical protein
LDLSAARASEPLPAHPIVDLFADVIGSKAVELQNFSLEAIAPTIDQLEIVVSEFDPLSLNARFGLSPSVCHLQPIHRFSSE